MYDETAVLEDDIIAVLDCVGSLTPDYLTYVLKDKWPFWNQHAEELIAFTRTFTIEFIPPPAKPRASSKGPTTPRSRSATPVDYSTSYPPSATPALFALSFTPAPLSAPKRLFDDTSDRPTTPSSHFAYSTPAPQAKRMKSTETVANDAWESRLPYQSPSPVTYHHVLASPSPSCHPYANIPTAGPSHLFHTHIPPPKQDHDTFVHQSNTTPSTHKFRIPSATPPPTQAPQFFEFTWDSTHT